MFTCPLCSFLSVSMIDHMRQRHPNYCVFCAEKEEELTKHPECSKLWDEGMEIYLDNDFVREWIH